MKTTNATTNHVCSCGSCLERLDGQGYSSTMRCAVCDRCTLIVDHPRFELYIGLSDFHTKRGDREDQRRLDDLDMANRLVHCLASDEWPSPATVADFGIESSEHYLALQHSVRGGIAAYDLDRVNRQQPHLTP